MAAVSVTAAEVLPISSVAIVQVDALLGATVTAGQAVYKDESVTPNTWKLAQADGTAAEATCGGIAMGGGASGQTVKVATAGALDPGFTVTVGEIYVLGATAGSIYPEADLLASDYVSIIGVGISASRLDLILKNTGVEVPA
jgi:hypothetical protein